VGGTACFLFYLNRHTDVPAAWGSAGGARTDWVAWLNALQIGLVSPLLAGIFGHLILQRRVVTRIGYLFLAIGLFSATMQLSTEYVVYNIFNRPIPLPGSEWVAWFVNSAWILYFTLLIYLLAIFPNGRFVSHFWRGLILILLFLFTAPNLIASAIETPLTSAFQIPNPLVTNELNLWYERLVAVGMPGMVLAVGAVLLSTLVRFRSSQGRERQQIKWLLFGVVAMLAAVVIGLTLIFEMDIPGGDVIVNGAFLGPLVGIGMALVRHQLYDIDIIIRRTLQYSVLTALLGLVYLGSVILLQTIFVGNGQSPLTIVISTLLIAALFTPLRRRVQALIDRRFFRQKYDAQQVLAAFALTARDETDLDALTEELSKVVGETMQPEGVGVWLAESRDNGTG